MDEYRKTYKVSAMCRVLKVSRSGIMPGGIDYQAHGGEPTQIFCSGFVRSTFRAGVFTEARGSLLSLMIRALGVGNTGWLDL